MKMISMFIFWKKWVKAGTYLLRWAQKQAGPQALSLPTTVVLQPQDHVDNGFFYPSDTCKYFLLGKAEADSCY